MIIAIDGPSGSGKSTASIGLAAALGFGYLDTGAIYRAVALAGGEVPVGLTISTTPSPAKVYIDGEDVSSQIRSQEVTAQVSAVAAKPEVREWVTGIIRSLIVGNFVVEGRDIGTVVAPDAGLKVFLTAREEIRSARRAAEWSSDKATAAESIAQRDAIDSQREVAPLRQADDAIVIDSSGKTIEQIVTELVALAKERL